MSKLRNLSLALGVAVLLTGCLEDFNIFKKEKSTQNAGAMKMPPAKVDVLVAKKADLPMSFNYPARIQSEQDVIVMPKVSGTLLKQNFKAGDTVKEGQTLFVIDPDKYKAAYDVLEANIAQAEATLKNASNEMKRVEKLFGQKAASKKEYDDALSAFENAKASLQSAKASAKSAKLDLDYTNVTAPFSGMVSENLVDVGAYITAGTTQLVRLTKIDPIEARFYITDVDSLERIKNVEQNRWEQINKDAVLIVGGQKYNGVVNFIDNTVDTTTGNVLAKAKFDNKEGNLLPGMFARIQMDGFIQKDSFSIPQIAILQDTVSPYVYIVKDGKVVKSNIKIIYQTVTEAYVTEGVNEGDVIILNNFKKIGVGASVEPDTQGKENK